MSEHERVVINRLATGVPGFDAVLGGGIPEYSFNMIAGAPGTGKTTLAEQIMFANATAERPAIHFTVLGEPPLKMLRYQQQFDFFDLSRVGTDIRFLNLSEEVLQRDLNVVFDRIVSEVESAKPGIVVVDSFRTVVRNSELPTSHEIDLQYFIQRLALRLTSWEATTFLIGEYGESEARSPVFTVADGIFWMTNEVERNATVRKLRVTKIRGQASLSGLHTFRITDAGVEVFPRQPIAAAPGQRRDPNERRSTGVEGLDAMMAGGIPAGDAVLVSGPTGAGKSILGGHFIAAGVAKGECGVIAVFEEHPETYIARAKDLGFDFDAMVAAGKLDIMYLRPLDLSVDETLYEIERRVHRLGAIRVVVDSLSGFEVALAPSFRQDFRESFYRLTQALTAINITIIATMETSGELRLHEILAVQHLLPLRRHHRHAVHRAGRRAAHRAQRDKDARERAQQGAAPGGDNVERNADRRAAHRLPGDHHGGAGAAYWHRRDASRRGVHSLRIRGPRSSRAVRGEHRRSDRARNWSHS